MDQQPAKSVIKMGAKKKARGNLCLLPFGFHAFFSLKYKEEESFCHVAMEAKKTVVLEVWQKKQKKSTCMTFQCMIAFRNKTVAHTFLSSFDNANSRPSLSRKVVEIQKTCFHGNRMLSLGITTHYHL